MYFLITRELQCRGKRGSSLQTPPWFGHRMTKQTVGRVAAEMNNLYDTNKDHSKGKKGGDINKFLNLAGKYETCISQMKKLNKMFPYSEVCLDSASK